MRGFVSVKGKGEMLCFWLDGEKPMQTVNTQELKSPQEKCIPNEAVPVEEKVSVSKAIAIVPPLTPQNSFNSKKSVSICANNGNDLRGENDQLFGSKKSSIFGKKKQMNLSNEKLQPLLSTIK